MEEINIIPYVLRFKTPAGTSRGVLRDKPSHFIRIVVEDRIGIGECSVIPGLSPDDPEEYHSVLSRLGDTNLDLTRFPSIRFGWETARRHLDSGSWRLFNNAFSRGEAPISINGLIWMGNRAFMLDQIKTKINAGWKCIKIKVGAIDFKTEIELIGFIRQQFSVSDVEIRLDANGGFTAENVDDRLHRLAEYGIQSIEQPIAAGQREAMAKVCASSPIPIALDEELIGIYDHDRRALLQDIRPHYIILKPSLLGGIAASEAWIELADQLNIGYWVTSALESNVGLNAIAQWTGSLNTTIPQGLGTGALFENNIDGPLTIRPGQLYYDRSKPWDPQVFL